MKKNIYKEHTYVYTNTHVCVCVCGMCVTESVFPDGSVVRNPPAIVEI